jgi:hypothetical protein
MGFGWFRAEELYPDVQPGQPLTADMDYRDIKQVLLWIKCAPIWLDVCHLVAVVAVWSAAIATEVPLSLLLGLLLCLQGGLGNCWLIAAISCVAEYAAHKGDPNADIASLFLTQQYHPGHPVHIQLHYVNETPGSVQRVVIEVDDRFPAEHDGRNWRPKFATPKGEYLSPRQGLLDTRRAGGGLSF